MTVLVTGGRGAVARSLTAVLRARGLPVRVASKDPQTGIRCDLADPATFAPALAGADAVFLYAEASTADAFVHEAVAAGVRHIVLLSSSSVRDEDLTAGARAGAVAEAHLAAERALAATPITTTVLRPGAFAANAAAWARPIRAGRSVSLPFPRAHTAPIHEDDIADCAAAVLTDPALAGRTYELTGPASLTFAEQIATIARVTGLDVATAQVTREAWKAEVAGHVPDGFADALLDLWQTSDGVPAPTAPGVPRLTGRPGRTFETWVRDHADRFTPAAAR